MVGCHCIIKQLKPVLSNFQKQTNKQNPLTISQLKFYVRDSTVGKKLPNMFLFSFRKTDERRQ